MCEQKKAVQALKAPKQEPEPAVQNKRPMEAKDAKEIAKKLIRSGAIRVPEKSQAITEKTTFKRSIVSLAHSCIWSKCPFAKYVPCWGKGGASTARKSALMRVITLRSLQEEN